MCALKTAVVGAGSRLLKARVNKALLSLDKLTQLAEESLGCDFLSHGHSMRAGRETSFWLFTPLVIEHLGIWKFSLSLQCGNQISSDSLSF